MQHPDFQLRNPNRARSLIASYCSNPAAFHRADASGYVFWSERVLELDSFNPQVAARLARALDRWRKLAEPYRQAIAELLEATVLPGLRSQIVTSKVTTPQDFHDRLWSFKGAGFGLEPLLLQSAWFRPHNRSEDVEGLYMVGAATHPGAGVPGVLMSAKALETVVPHVLSR